jgi:hypothetical protein
MVLGSKPDGRGFEAGHNHEVLLSSVSTEHYLLLHTMELNAYSPSRNMWVNGKLICDGQASCRSWVQIAATEPYSPSPFRNMYESLGN